MARLVLVTPSTVDLATFPATLEAAVSAGDVASLIVALDGGSEMTRQRLAEILTPIAQAHDVAVLVRNDTRAAGRSRADGVHVDTGLADLENALETFHPNGIVGVGGLATRHEAMEAGDTAVDYVFFGDLDRRAPSSSPPGGCRCSSRRWCCWPARRSPPAMRRRPPARSSWPCARRSGRIRAVPPKRCARPSAASPTPPRRRAEVCAP